MNCTRALILFACLAATSLVPASAQIIVDRAGQPGQRSHRYPPSLIRSVLAQRGLPPMGRGHVSPAAARARPHIVPGQYIVKFKPNTSDDVRAGIHAAAGARVISRIPELDIHTVAIPDSAVAAYKADPHVMWIEPNAMRYPLQTSPNDPAYNNFDYSLPIDPSLATWFKWDTHLIDAVDGWGIWPNMFFTAAGGKGNHAVTVAVIDTGIDYSHPDFMNGGATTAVSGGGQLMTTPDETIFSGVVTAGAPDAFGHGTHVSGIAAASTNNGIGTVGNGYNANVIEVRVTDANGNGSSSDLAAAIVYVANQGAVAVNISLGDYTFSQAEQNAIDYAWNHGTLIIAAAGNDGDVSPPPAIYPAALSKVLAVSATSFADSISSYSSYGDWVGIGAPGGDFDLTAEWFIDVYSTMPTYPVTLNGPDYGVAMDYDYLEGTSMASPQVMGTAALVAGQMGITTATPGAPLRIWQALEEGADDIDASGGWDPYVGFGRLNIFNTMNLPNVPNPRGDTAGCIIGQVEYLGTPVQNAEVIATPTVGSGSFEGVTRPDGGYRIPNLPAGTYNVTATYFSSSVTTNNVVVIAGCDTPGIDYNINASVALTGLSIAPTTVTGPATATGTITLSGTAPSGGFAVTVTSSNSAVASPASTTVTVPFGSATTTFTIHTSTTTGPIGVTFTATAGSASFTAPLTVAGGPANGAAFITQSVPATMTAGHQYAVSVTMENVGTNNWTAAGLYVLGPQNPQDNTTWGGRQLVPQTVTPGQQVTFSFNVTAPAANGTYNFDWQMLQEHVGWFGALSTNVAVTVTGGTTGGGTDGASFVSQTVPTTMTAGQTYSVSVTMQNSGTSTWTTASYQNGSQNPQDNSTWGVDRVALPTSVAPGAQVTFTFNVTAPSTAGTYNFQRKMVHTGVGWFGAVSTNVAVTVTGGGGGGTDGATFVSQTVPTTMTHGQTYQVTVVMRNSGTSTWTTAGYQNGSQFLQDNTTWGVDRVALPTSTAPGAQATFTFNVTAPSTPGTYHFQRRMVHLGVGWFGDFSPIVTVTVN